MKRRTLLRACGASAVLGQGFIVTTAALAQGAAYPNRTLHIVVPFGPGGPTDLTARLAADKLSQRWNLPVVVENIAGAGGSVGSEKVARSAPDGYTIVLGVTGSHGINVSLDSKLGYDPLKDFEPLTHATSFPNVIAVHPSVPVQNLAGLVKLARAKPGTLSYGSDGNGTASHLGMEMIKAEAHVFMVHIPYRGGAAMLNDLVSGQIQVGITGLPTALPLAKAGKIRLLAVTTAQRAPAAPDVPTVAEQGFPGYVAAPWSGFFAPKGTPKSIVDKLAGDLIAVLTLPDVRERMAAVGSSIVASRPEDFRSFVQAEIERWGRAVKTSGATIN